MTAGQQGTAAPRFLYSLGNEAEARAFLRDVCWGAGSRHGNAVFTCITPAMAGPVWVRLMGEHYYGSYVVTQEEEEDFWT